MLKKIIKNRSDIGAGTRGSDMGIDAIEIAAINKENNYFCEDTREFLASISFVSFGFIFRYLGYIKHKRKNFFEFTNEKFSCQNYFIISNILRHEPFAHNSQGCRISRQPLQ